MLTPPRRRDRDQVVYRETAPSPKLVRAHHSCTKKDPTEKDKMCDQCTENVRKTPRIVMVDQLWMWVLDESESTPFHTLNWSISVLIADFLQIRSLHVFQRGGAKTNLTHLLYRNAFAQG